MRYVWLVALGGALGAVGRYGVAVWLFDVSGRFPWHTLAVNLAGSFAMGLLFALSLRDTPRLFLLTGFLGGFTTFSTFSLEALSLLQAGRLGAALLYVGVSLIGGIALVSLGFTLARALAPHPA